MRIVKHETVRHAIRMNATMRTAQGKPTTGMSCSRMMGNTTPPLALPPVVSPIANARRRRNQCPSAAIAGLNLRISQIAGMNYGHSKKRNWSLQKCDPNAK